MPLSNLHKVGVRLVTVLFFFLSIRVKQKLQIANQPYLKLLDADPFIRLFFTQEIFFHRTDLMYL